MSADGMQPPEGVRPEFVPLPQGARDLLPETCRRWGLITRSLLERFDAWGYRQVRPPAIEYFEVLARGLDASERERCVRFVEGGSGRLVALRSDVTPQIARMVAQRVGGSIDPSDQLRLSYVADSIRAPGPVHGPATQRAETHQVGVEFLGEPNPVGDAELLVLADEALSAVGLQTHRFDLGETSLVRRALEHVAPESRAEVREALAKKDPGAMQKALNQAGACETPALANAIASLAKLFGEPQDILARAREQLSPLGVEAHLDRLESLLEAVKTLSPDLISRIELDLGEARGHEYYTGLRIRVWAPGSGEPVLRGGRYDQLLGRYGADMAASGFAIDLDALEAALRDHGELVAPEIEPGEMFALESTHASVEARLNASRQAGELRSKGTRAWVELCPSLARAKDRATRGGATRLNWASDHGSQLFTRAKASEIWSEVDT